MFPGSIRLSSLQVTSATRIRDRFGPTGKLIRWADTIPIATARGALSSLRVPFDRVFLRKKVAQMSHRAEPAMLSAVAMGRATGPGRAAEGVFFESVRLAL